MLSSFLWKIFVGLDLLRKRTYGSVIRRKLKVCGSGVTIDQGVDLQGPSAISLGQGTYVGKGCIFVGYGEITIGRDCSIAAGCKLITRNHRVDVVTGYKNSGYDYAPVSLGDNVWLGYNVIVLPGVSIGDHAVVAAGAVVTKTIPRKEVWGGVPAKFIRRIEG